MHEPDRDRVDDRPNEAEMGQEERERQHAQDRAPDDELGAEPVGQRSAEKSARSDRGEEDEQHHLRRWIDTPKVSIR